MPDTVRSGQQIVLVGERGDGVAAGIGHAHHLFELHAVGVRAIGADGQGPSALLDSGPPPTRRRTLEWPGVGVSDG